MQTRRTFTAFFSYAHHDADTEYKVRLPDWGIAAAPLIEGKLVIVMVSGSPAACIIAFDKNDGKEVWKYNVQKKYGNFSIQHGMHITPLSTISAQFFAEHQVTTRFSPELVRCF